MSERSWQSIVQALGLSTREAQVARLILSNDDSETAIADRLSISPHTVHTHLERLYRKLAVSSRCQVVARIFQQYVELAGPPPRPSVGAETPAAASVEPGGNGRSPSGGRENRNRRP